VHTRQLAHDGPNVSEIGLGTWQLGGTEWGELSDDQALDTLRAAADAGVTFIDTADIYGMGRSESLIGRFLKERPDRDRFVVATKLGRNPTPGWPRNFTRDTIFAHTEASLERLGVDALDLMQTHSIPTQWLSRFRVFDHLNELKRLGKIRAFGASVESMDEALWCLEQEGLSSLQIIFNIFRQKPIEVLFAKAKELGVAIIVRLPLASGLLSGKITRQTTFAPTDHRSFNREGKSFNVGETFAGLPLEKGIDLVDVLRELVPEGMTMAQFALRWCLDFDAVSAVIPGARRADQARDNAAASDLPPLSPALHEQIKHFYREQVAEHIRGVY
jgi:aryl-alcohol dehydrogenase-like predicted oxidoreductase